MKKSVLIIIFLAILLVLIVIIQIINNSEPKQVVFLTDFNNKEAGCFGGNYGAGCEAYVIFSYEGKEYNLSVGINGYPKYEMCLLQNTSCIPYKAIDSVNLTDGKIKIQGIYDKKSNVLYNISLIQ